MPSIVAMEASVKSLDREEDVELTWEEEKDGLGTRRSRRPWFSRREEVEIRGAFGERSGVED